MDKTSICYGANIVLKLLSNKFLMTFEELKNDSGLQDADLGAAIAWLLHESKIEIVKDKTNGLDMFQIPQFNPFF